MDIFSDDQVSMSLSLTFTNRSLKSNYMNIVDAKSNCKKRVCLIIFAKYILHLYKIISDQKSNVIWEYRSNGTVIAVSWYRAERMRGTAYSGRMVPVPNVRYTRCQRVPCRRCYRAPWVSVIGWCYLRLLLWRSVSPLSSMCPDELMSLSMMASAKVGSAM